MPIVIDVDTGIDDALALLYLCGSPEVELLGAVCTAGNIDARQVEINTRAVLELGGLADTEVALGREIPLVRPLTIAPETHGPRGLGYAELPAPRRGLSSRHGADMLIALGRERPGEITLITTGPVTNLAVALQREPNLPRLLKGYVMMAGSYRTAGNTAPTTEWIVAVDPEAMALVLGAWAATNVPRPLAFGLDVTERAKLTPDHLAELRGRVGAGADDNPVLRFVDDALRFYMEFHSRYDGFYGAFIHDALAVAGALDRSLVRVEALAVEVELAGTWTSGETVTDWRRVWGKPPNLDIAVEANVAAFFDRFIERVANVATRHSKVAS
jgi:purine nucleosidase